MVNAILGKKLAQTQIFTEDGVMIPVTHIQAGPCSVVQVKTRDNDGYSALQLGFGQVTPGKISKPQKGHVQKTGKATKTFPKFLQEIRLDEEKESKLLKPGDMIRVADVFDKGDAIKVTGTTKGKGFAGVVKRHGFAGGPRTHGQSDRERAPGSIGQTTTPGRVYKGKRMAGRMGGQKTTISGLSVVSIDQEKNVLTVKGLVPGNVGGLLIICKQ